MATRAPVRTDAIELHPLGNAIRNTEARLGQAVRLGAHDLWRLDGDHRWRMIICVSGEIWVTQERDLQDYVLTSGDMLLVSQPGSVLIEALCDAAVEITAPLKNRPYRGPYPIFH